MAKNMVLAFCMWSVGNFWAANTKDNSKMMNLKGRESTPMQLTTDMKEIAGKASKMGKESTIGLVGTEEGEWENGNIHGRAIYYYANGESKERFYEKGKRMDKK